MDANVGRGVDVRREKGKEKKRGEMERIRKERNYLKKGKERKSLFFSLGPRKGQQKQGKRRV